MPARVTEVAASTTAQAPPMSILMLVRLRLLAGAGASFICALPPHEGWPEASDAIRPGDCAGGRGSRPPRVEVGPRDGDGRSSGDRRPEYRVPAGDPDRQPSRSVDGDNIGPVSSQCQ